jgi:recombination protein RecR
MAIEETGQFSGRYHVLGGVISPLEGIGLDQLNIDTLIERVKSEETEELIMAISPTIDGDTTIYYITKKVSDLPVKVTTLARGISFGGELEYADGLTLGRSIASRLPYQVQSES